jgi:LPXTG-site transpeptidase (sortase) family protein
MKHKRLALIGLLSPIFIVGFCLFGLLFLGGLSWLIFGPANNGPITHIATVGPFFTAKILPGVSSEPDPASGAAPASQPGPNAAVQPQGDPNQAGGIQQAAAGPALTDEEVATQLGFALPAGSVNSITYEGVGSRLVIPAMSLDAPIVLAPIENQTWNVDDLDQKIGHLEGTARPGANSNLVLAGHVTLDSGIYGPFAGLGQLNPGDTIIVYDNDQRFEYMVDSHQTVPRTAVEVTFPTDTAQITLITCNNWNAEAERYDERLVVKGHLITN